MTRRRMLRATLGAAAGLVAVQALRARSAAAAEGPDDVVRRWNSAVLQAIRVTRPGPPMGARALAVVHTCMFDAWAAYDPVAVGTRLGGDLRRPASERTPDRRREAISYAAFRALTDLFPSEIAWLARSLQDLGYDPVDATADPRTPRGIGNLAAREVLEFRHQDGSNQLGDLHFGAYSDYTHYGPLNDYDRLDDPGRWQPLRVRDYRAGLVVQKFVAPHWGRVVPFALQVGSQFRPEVAPPAFASSAYQERADELIEISAALDDRRKAIVEYWADGPGSEQPPGHWCLLAQFVSLRDRHDLDADTKLFFALANALHDAAIAAWDAKRAFDYVRPISAVRFLHRGLSIQAWGGPGRGTRELDGAQWLPYQVPTVVTPAFPEFVSGHSTFSGAAATVLQLFTGDDAFGASHVVRKGSSRIEPGLTPTADVSLSWATFSEAADQAGLSRRYGGIHFADGDLAGRAIGREVGTLAWERAERYWTGRP